MRPVNLLPPSERPQARTLPGRALAVGAGGLALVGAMGVLYMSTTQATTQASDEADGVEAQVNQINVQLASLRAAQASSAGQVDRIATVQQLAAGRADWERVFRHLSRTLPAGVSFVRLEATTPTMQTTAAVTGVSATAAPTATAGTADLALTGYAVSMPRIAELLVRIGAVPELRDVTLVESAVEDAASAAGTGAPAAAAPTSGAVTRLLYKWSINASLRSSGADAGAATAAGATPATPAPAPATTPTPATTASGAPAPAPSPLVGTTATVTATPITKTLSVPTPNANPTP